jgi:multiple sugar transport system ATP-binding protein
MWIRSDVGARAALASLAALAALALLVAILYVEQGHQEGGMASVTYRSVSKRFGETLAVNSLSIDIADKEFLVFVGPSGCGKTTSLRLLAGLEEVDEGEIFIDDAVVNDVLPKDRDIAMVFQSYALYPHMSVYDNLSFGLKLRHTPKNDIDTRVKEAAGILRIDQLLNRKPKQLSGGERQRVALGRAIVRHPKVFLMDEPLSNLDAKLRVQTRAELIKLHERLQATFIYVTHDQTEAMTMGTRIAVMDKGLLQQVDTPQNLYDAPANVFVAGFIGSPAMNFFDAQLVTNGDGVDVAAKVFRLPLPADRVPLAKPHLGKSIVLGIRPEDVYVSGHVPDGTCGSDINARVDVRELMGNEIFLHLAIDGTMFVARVTPRATVNSGETVCLTVDTTRLHIFDKDSSKAISGPTTRGYMPGPVVTEQP